MTYDYLIEGVEPKEYEALNKRKVKIIENLMGNFNDVWEKKVRNVKVSFTYNKKVGAIGITLNRDEKEHLVLERKGLSDGEDAVVVSLYSDLEKELKNIRIKEGFWA